jgi:hypothetical protein
LPGPRGAPSQAEALGAEPEQVSERARKTREREKKKQIFSFFFFFLFFLLLLFAVCAASPAALFMSPLGCVLRGAARGAGGKNSKENAKKKCFFSFFMMTKKKKRFSSHASFGQFFHGREVPRLLQHHDGVLARAVSEPSRPPSPPRSDPLQRTTVMCGSCNTVLCQPTGGKARLTEGCAFRRKAD